MKRFVLGLLLILLALGWATGVAYAAPLAFEISGRVVDGTPPTPAANASVKIYCEASRPNLAADVTSDADGHFLAIINAVQCPLGSDLIAVAKWNGKTGGYHTIVGEHTDILLELGTPIPVPEYGAVGGLVTASIGIGLMLRIRRRF